MGRTLRVKALPKSQQTARAKWQLLVSGGRKSKHKTKRRAVKVGKDKMRAADTLVVEKMSGAVDYRQEGPRA